uniref:Uncharacterized protein n=1 Tax=Panagrolaimus sp. ES5 TaxID=591445 RepID=A0AC34EZR8_9BILA
MLMLLSPIVLTILYFMAIKFGKKFLYQLTAFCWFLLTVLLITFYFAAVIYSISQNSLRVLDDLIVALFFVLILVIHSVIGFLSTLSLLQKVHAKVNGYDGNTFENQNFVALQELDYLNVNHQIEHPNIYPQIFTL